MDNGFLSRWHSLVLEAKQANQLSVKVDNQGENRLELPDGHKGSLVFVPEVLLGGIDQRQNSLHPGKCSIMSFIRYLPL